MNQRKANFLRWLGFVGAYRGWLALALGAVAGCIAVDVSIPRVFAFVVDELLSPAAVAAELPLAGPTSLPWAFLYVGVFLAGLVLAKALFQFARTMLLTLSGEHIHLDIRSALFAHIHRLPISYFDSSFTGKIMARVTTDADALWSLLYNGVNDVVAPALSLTVILVIVALGAPALSLVLLVILPVFALLYFQARRKVQDSTRQQRDTLSVLYSRLQEQISGVRTVRVYGMAGEETQRFRDILIRLYQHNIGLMRTWATLGSLGDFITGIGVALVLCVGGWFAASGQITVGQLVQFYGYTGMLFVPVQTIANTLARVFPQADVALERIFELMDQEPAREFHGTVPCPPLAGEIRVEGVSFGYKGDKPVLRDVSLKIAARSTVAFVGPSGAGKTSLVNLICRFYDFQGGRILVDGLDITTLETVSFRSQVSYVSQDTFLFSGTVFENIQYAKPDASRAEVEEAARQANADRFIRALPEGYDTILGERGLNLSGGQKQRLNIARALLRRPGILIMDEPTSALDAESEAVILEALATSFRGLTCIVIAHRLSTVMAADRIFVFDQGGLVQQGSHAALVAQEGLYQNLCRKQFLASGS